MYKCTIQHRTVPAENVITNYSVISVKRSFRQRFGNNGIGTEKSNVTL